MSYQACCRYRHLSNSTDFTKGLKVIISFPNIIIHHFLRNHKTNISNDRRVLRWFRKRNKRVRLYYLHVTIGMLISSKAAPVLMFNLLIVAGFIKPKYPNSSLLTKNLAHHAWSVTNREYFLHITKHTTLNILTDNFPTKAS
jgi:hypothetical protein